MAIDQDKIMNWPFKQVEQTYTAKDSILYALRAFDNRFAGLGRYKPIGLAKEKLGSKLAFDGLKPARNRRMADPD